MPAPDTVIYGSDGMSWPAMFQYAGEGDDAAFIADQNGFEILYLYLEDDSEELFETYMNDSDFQKLFEAWKPAPPVGWNFGGAYDTEDGPIAIFLKKKPE